MPDLVKIRFTALEQALGLPTPLVDGTVSVVAWAGNEPLEAVDGDTVTFAVGKCVPIAGGQPAEEILLPPSGAWCYRWVVTDTRTGQSLVRYTTVPNVDEIDFGDLPVVDPQTFEPTPDVVQGWNAALKRIQEELQDHEERISSLEDLPPSPVTSVNGQIGDVVLGASDVPSSAGTVQVDLDSLDLRVTDLEDNPPVGGVSSVNGQTGAVTLGSADIPTPDGNVQGDLSDLDTRVTDLEDNPTGAVDSVNGRTGVVVLTAEDIAATGETVQDAVDRLDSSDSDLDSRVTALEEEPAPTAPVTSVNGETGEVSLVAGGIPSTDGTVQIDLDSLDLRVTDLEDNPTGAVSSVNGETGDVVLTSSDITTPSGTVQSGLEDLDTRVTDLEDSPGGGVSSVNGQTGDVTLTATDISATGETVQGAISRLDSVDDDLDSRVSALEDAPDPGAPVTSVNGQTGDVVLGASDVGALPASYTAPVTSVNGKTGSVDLTAGDISSESGSVQGDLSSLAASVATNTSELANHESRIEDLESNPGGGVSSVNGLTGDVELTAAEIPYRTGLSSATALSRVLAEDIVPQLDDLVTPGRYAVGPNTLNLPGPILGGVVEVTVVPNYLDIYRVIVQSLKVIWGTTAADPPVAGQGYQRYILEPLSNPGGVPTIGPWVANETELNNAWAPSYRGLVVGNGTQSPVKIATGAGTQHFAGSVRFGSTTTGPTTPAPLGFSLYQHRVAMRDQIVVGAVAGYGSVQETTGANVTPLLAFWGIADSTGPTVYFHRMGGEPLTLAPGELPTGGVFSYTLTHQYGPAT